MAPTTLKDLYETKAFTDITIVAGDSTTRFPVHKFIFSASPGLKALVETNGEVLQLSESPALVERLLQWFYGVPWAGMRVDLDSSGDGAGGLGELEGLARAAEKYHIPNLRENIHSIVTSQVLPRLTTPEQIIEAMLVGLCEDGFRGEVRKSFLERLRALVVAPSLAGSLVGEGEGAQAAPPWSATLVVPPLLKPGALGSKKRGLSDVSGLQQGHDTTTPSAKPAKRAKKEPTTKKLRAAGPLPLPSTNKPTKPAQPQFRSAKIPSTNTALSLHPTTMPPSPLPPPTAAAPTYCICQTTSNDEYLVQCDLCDHWFHPACIGKSEYDDSTVRLHRQWAMEMDVLKLGVPERGFVCRWCEEKEKEKEK